MPLDSECLPWVKWMLNPNIFYELRTVVNAIFLGKQ